MDNYSSAYAWSEHNYITPDVYDSFYKDLQKMFLWYEKYFEC